MEFKYKKTKLNMTVGIVFLINSIIFIGLTISLLIHGSGYIFSLYTLTLCLMWAFMAKKILFKHKSNYVLIKNDRLELQNSLLVKKNISISSIRTCEVDKHKLIIRENKKKYVISCIALSKNDINKIISEIELKANIKVIGKIEYDKIINKDKHNLKIFSFYFIALILLSVIITFYNYNFEKKYITESNEQLTELVFQDSSFSLNTLEEYKSKVYEKIPYPSKAMIVSNSDNAIIATYNFLFSEEDVEHFKYITMDKDYIEFNTLKDERDRFNFKVNIDDTFTYRISKDYRGVFIPNARNDFSDSLIFRLLKVFSLVCYFAALTVIPLEKLLNKKNT